MSALLQRFSLIDWALLAGYFGLMFLIGHSTAKKKTDAEAYFLGQRQMPTWMVAFSIVATSLSVATFVGVPQLSYTGDLTYISLNIGGFLAVFIVAGVFIPRLYRAGTITIYGYLDQRFGETAKIATSAMFLIGRLLASGARLFIAAIPVCLLLFGSFEPSKAQLVTAIVLIGALGTAYTVAGGIKAVIWTDTIQLCIVMGTTLLTIGLLLYIYYGRPDLMGAAAPSDPMRTIQQVYPQFLLYHLPAGLRGLAIAGMFAAAQGSLDSAINAMASSAVADLYWPLRRKLG